MCSVDLVVRPQADQERLVAIPAEQDPKVVIGAEGPVGRQLGLQLVRPKQGILGVDREASKCRTKERGLRFLELLRSSNEATRGREPQLSPGARRGVARRAPGLSC